MLIVLRDGPHLELGRTQAGVHTEIPVETQPHELQGGGGTNRFQKRSHTPPWAKGRRHTADSAPQSGRMALTNLPTSCLPTTNCLLVPPGPASKTFQSEA